ncbi:Autophagy protein 7 [Podila epigama]|nr:Autophagy protein 7 [Podila epigama]
MLLQFHPWASAVEAPFWQVLTQRKMDVFKLDDSTKDIHGYYSTGQQVKLPGKETTVALPARLCLGPAAFPEQESSASYKNPAFTFPAPGVLKNTNTIEDFKAIDKAKIFLSVAEQIWNDITSGHAIQSPDVLNRFLLITFADLKKFKFYYWFAFPALVATPTWTYSAMGDISATWSPAQVDSLRDQLGQYRQTHSQTQHGFFLVRQLQHDSSLEVAPLQEWESFYAGYDDSQAVGWEKNAQGKLGPRLADLAPLMDPARLADTAVDLNLKLMRWRLLPGLELEKVQGTRCLLLGAGTLGCYVARSLLGWGVRNITFVDSAKVSFSNPVRQPLFDFEDCLEGGKEKAATAAANLRRVYPGVNAVGISMSIPMPGHPISAQGYDAAHKDVERLEHLFDEHDAIFLLMDSRESRWLPTLLGARKNKIVINAALGFDTFLVMRHGVGQDKAYHSTSGSTPLGCYFCNDVVAPTDSLSDRTLDQQCTVTRPGLSAIASAMAVEMLVSLLHHPSGVRAPADRGDAGEDDSGASGSDRTSGSTLGLLPHQIRGFLSRFKNLLISGQAYDRCTACSDAILETYEREGFEFLLKVFQDAKHLEDVTGLTQMKEESENLDMDWDEDEDDDMGSDDDLDG